MSGFRHRVLGHGAARDLEAVSDFAKGNAGFAKFPNLVDRRFFEAGAADLHTFGACAIETSLYAFGYKRSLELSESRHQRKHGIAGRGIGVDAFGVADKSTPRL